MILSGSQRQQLLQALLSAFPNTMDLVIMVSIQLEQVLNQIAGGRTYRDTTFELIGWAEAQGRLDDLIEGARKQNPGNPLLIQFEQQFKNDPAQQPRRAFERWVQETNAFQDAAIWVNRLVEILPRVCRVQVGPSTFGTGFLLGPDAVITNYHVVEKVIEDKGHKPEDVILTFDYHRSIDGKEPGEGKKFLLKLSDWLIDSSPYSQADLIAEASALPEKDQLDYALLRVEGAPGNQKIGGTPEIPIRSRGYIGMLEESYDFQPETSLFIVQHPGGQPLQLALSNDAVLCLNSNGTRVRYQTNTLGGSSGSPCFNAQWELVALHHSGDPNFDALHKPTYNEGIPFSKIRSLLKARGKLNDDGIA